MPFDHGPFNFGAGKPKKVAIVACMRKLLVAIAQNRHDLDPENCCNIGMKLRQLLSPIIPLTESSLMTVYGVIERDATTVYVVAGRLVDHSEMLGGLATSSRNFQ